jgi:uncharacterized small protein (DUF1192 family)
VLGEEASAEMLSYFPARDVEEPATKELVLLTRAEFKADIAEVRVEIEKLRADMHQSLQRLTFAIIATIVAFGGVLLSASAMFQS